MRIFPASIFPLSDVRQLQERAVKARQIITPAPEGWSKSSINPMGVLAVFEPLWIRKGHVLRSYQYREANDGHGVVWAMPADADFPDPEKCLLTENVLLGPPKPPRVLEDFMAAIEGDGSQWSYFCASLLGRELQELGAALHGCKWSTHLILDENPLSKPRKSEASYLSLGSPEQWAWMEPDPSEWRPCVIENEDSITVNFLTFSGYLQRAIYHHADRFSRGTYRFTTQSRLVASGPTGYVLC